MVSRALEKGIEAPPPPNKVNRAYSGSKDSYFRALGRQKGPSYVRFFGAILSLGDRVWVL